MPDCTKEAEKGKFLEKLNRKVTKEMKELVKSEKGQVRIKIDDKNKRIIPDYKKVFLATNDSQLKKQNDALLSIMNTIYKVLSTKN